MQVLIFKLGNDRYGLSTRSIVRVLPLVDFKRLPQAPAYVAGLMNYHGTSIPVIDLQRLACDNAFAPCFDTRIILVEYPTGDGSSRMLGLIAEHVVGVQKLSIDQFSATGVASTSAPYLGMVASIEANILQLVELEQLLAPDVRALLFQAATDDPSC